MKKLTIQIILISLAILYPVGSLNAFNDEKIGENARIQRKEICWRVQNELRPELGIENINKCATTFTLNYAVESGYGKYPVRKNNYLGLKGYREDGSYGFLEFESEYKAGLYWAESYYTYHYKKSIFTYIYGYKQKDGSYKWGYTATQKEIYYNFFTSKWDKIYKDIKNLKLIIN